MKNYVPPLKNYEEMPQMLEIITTDSPVLETSGVILKLGYSKNLSITISKKREFRVSVEFSLKLNPI